MTEDGAYRYADWEVRPRERTLRVRGELQKIGARAFDVLLALIHHGDRVMSRAELLDAAWPGLVVEENNLSVQVSTLRRLLGPLSIVNVAGLGYRLAVAPADAPTTVPAMAAPVRTAPTPAPATGLIGRDDEIATLLPRLAAGALTTIVGTGGVGKSSLARALLAASETTWRDGVHWIDLESLTHGTDLLSLVARSLGVVMDDDGLASGDVLRSLSRLGALVVLDNCEHLIDDVTRCVAPLLRAASSIQWLATSQEPLHLPGEEVFRLLPLHVAAADATVDEATSCGAIALLHQRVQAADRTFVLDASNVAMALDLCRALDGLPLAIEMAAARVATLGLQGVHAQLNLSMTLRSGLRQSAPRHHTLRQAYEWSYGLLSSVEQRLFRALQPLQGGFTAAFLEKYVVLLDEPAVRAEGNDPLEALSLLVDKSLLQKMPAGGPGTAPRYRMLESAREFALLQLNIHGETDATRARHAEAIATWFDGAENDWRSWQDARWAAHYLPERENVIAALAWACSRDDSEDLWRLLAAAAQLETFANGEIGVVGYALPLERLKLAPPSLRARACSAVGWAHFLDGHRVLGAQLLEQALADYEFLADKNGTFLVLTRLIRLHQTRSGTQSVRTALWERLKLIPRSTIPLRLRIYEECTVAQHFHPQVAVQHLAQLSRLAQLSGFDSEAVLCQLIVTDELLRQERYSEAVDAASGVLLQNRPFLRQHATIVNNQALALVRLDRIDEARHAARRLLRAVPSDAHMVMDLFALAAVQAGRFDDAALLIGRSTHIKEKRHCDSEPAEAAVVSDTLRALRVQFATAELSRLLDVGASMSSDDVLAIADLA